jgi:hypothetical protein
MADQAVPAELKNRRYSAEAPITPSIASAAAASPAVAVLRVVDSVGKSRHTVSLIKLPDDQSAYSSAAQKPLTSALLARRAAEPPMRSKRQKPINGR